MKAYNYLIKIGNEYITFDDKVTVGSFFIPSHTWNAWEVKQTINSLEGIDIFTSQFEDATQLCTYLKEQGIYHGEVDSIALVTLESFQEGPIVRTNVYEDSRGPIYKADALFLSGPFLLDYLEENFGDTVLQEEISFGLRYKLKRPFTIYEIRTYYFESYSHRHTIASIVSHYHRKKNGKKHYEVLKKSYRPVVPD